MRLVVVSGRSGSGKSTALQVLEDTGFYCVDNLPVALLPALAAQLSSEGNLKRAAVGIDARNVPGQLERFPQLLRELESNGDGCEIIYLDADDDTLLKRFSATRRKHPLSTDSIPLAEALEQERRLLEPIATLADLVVDTSQLTVHGLRTLVRERVVGKQHKGLALLFESFGFKNGVPPDADFVFDVRCLPNPYWDTALRAQTGLDREVQGFMRSHADVQVMVDDIAALLLRWLPRFAENDRSYMTVAIGCTGGQHRSVYVSERLAEALAGAAAHVQVRHRELAAAQQGDRS
jgi:UPF0042 nucleotide-binding protein